MKKEEKNIINLFKHFCYNGCRIEYGEKYTYLNNIFPNCLVSKYVESDIFQSSFVVRKIYNTKTDIRIFFNKIFVPSCNEKFEYRLEHKDKFEYRLEHIDKYYCLKSLEINEQCDLSEINFISKFAYTQVEIYKIISDKDMYEPRQKIKLHMYEDCFGSTICLYFFLINTICPDLKNSIIDLIFCVKKWNIFDVNKLLNIYEH